jgi:DNA polymerase-1
MTKSKQKLVIIDSNALIHRAFHALPPLTDRNGQLINAVMGYTMILLKTIKDIKPDYIAACFDHKEKTFRHKEFEAYKAQRVKAPDELYNQIPLVKEILGAFNIPIYEKAGFEADDLIGTIAHLKSVDRPDIETIIVTGDQDAYQLIDSNTMVLAPHKGLSETMLYDIEAIREKFQGLTPNQLIDYKGIRGDVSDNIPGVKGIGEKGAIDLLNNFQTLENIYANIDSPKIKDRTRELLKQYHDDAILSKRLATIILDVPIDFKLADSDFSGFDMQKVIEVFQKFNFKRLLSQLQTLAADNKIKVNGGHISY